MGMQRWFIGLLMAAILVLLLGVPLAVLFVTGVLVLGLMRFYFQRGP